jgi:hypothetical protein
MRGKASVRQLKLLSMIEARHGVEIDEAARELGALRRTVYRDLEVLQHAGFPLISDRHEGGRARWRVIPGFRQRLQLSFTWSELLALMVAQQQMAGLGGTVFADSATSALEKIRASLPRGLAEQNAASRGHSGMSLRRFPPCAHFCGAELGAPKLSADEASSRPSVLTAYPARRESCPSRRRKVFGDGWLGGRPLAGSYVRESGTDKRGIVVSLCA